MVIKLPKKHWVASFDVDPQKTFTVICPDELPIAGGDEIVDELNAQAEFAALRVASRDAHTLSALWLATAEQPQYSAIIGYPNLDIRWKAHAIVGTKGFEFIAGLDPAKYDFQVYKGIQPDMHPYGACYHDLANKLSTGVIEFLKLHGINTVIVGGLAIDYCVKNTVLQLAGAGFSVILNLGACRGIAPDTTSAALMEMEAAGVQIIASCRQLSKTY